MPQQEIAVDIQVLFEVYYALSSRFLNLFTL